MIKTNSIELMTESGRQKFLFLQTLHSNILTLFGVKDPKKITLTVNIFM